MSITAPSVTTIHPAVQGMPAVLAFSRGEVTIDTPLGPMNTQVEATLTGASMSDIGDLLADMADPKSAIREAMGDARSWKSNNRQVQVMRSTCADGTIVTAQVAATSLNEEVAILGALSEHEAVQMAR